MLTAVGFDASVYDTVATTWQVAGLAAGDLNADGVADLLLGAGDGKFSVHLGRPDGTFESGINHQSTGGKADILLHDAIGDGRSDLMATSSGNVYANWGNGDGTFDTMFRRLLTGGGHRLIKGDFNGDGKSDFATANPGTDTVSALLANGDGTFSVATTVVPNAKPLALAAGDFNGDGWLDLVTGRSDAPVTVLMGNGDGTFSIGSSYQLNSGASSMIVADYNNDEMLDVAVVHGSSRVTMLLGSSNGSFDVSTWLGGGGWFVNMGDFNGDGNVDLVTATPNAQGVSVLLGAGDGAFSAPAVYGVGATRSLTVADFNGDGRADIAAGGRLSDGSNALNVLLSTAITEPPVANAGGPYTVVTGQSIQLDGSGSTDNSIAPLAYEWDLDNDGQHDDATGAAPTFSAAELAAGTYTVNLKVADDEGLTNTASTTVTVIEPPVASPGGPYSVVEGYTIQLDGTDSTDNSTTPLIYEWDLDGDGIFGETDADALQGNEAGATPTFSAVGLAAGTYTVSLKVSDDEGLSHTASTTVEVITAAAFVDNTVTSVSTQVTDLQTTGLLTESQAGSLQGKLDSATASLESGNTSAAVGKVTATINQIDAILKKKKTSAETAEALTALSAELDAALALL